jgi:hypothetical protein
MPREPRLSVRAKLSCLRCRRRKKRCDRTLPQCGDCMANQASCSFLDEQHESASYSVAYVSSLEERLRGLEQERRSEIEDPALGAMASETQGHFPSPSVRSRSYRRGSAVSDDELTDEHSDTIVTNADVFSMPDITPATRPRTSITTPHSSSPQARSGETLASNLKSISLAAVAEPYLGAMSGLTFAKLTQAVLRRLAPDGGDFVFNPQFDGVNFPVDGVTTTHLDIMSNMYLEYDSAVTSSWLAGDNAMPMTQTLFPVETSFLLSIPERSEAIRLATFYFDHSHTLYPIVSRREVMSDLNCALENPDRQPTQSPPSAFRIWMILAIASTAHSSITLNEESTSRQYYEKAMTYFEAAMDYGDIAALEAIMLQVSYSFFNQLGPNTWFLVGTAARLAIGMGFHCEAAYHGLPREDVARRQRLFFSIYMMDRLVSITLGRPFSLHEDDIDINPFAIEIDEGLDADPDVPQSTLCQPPLAITAHILRLRKIANDIATKVYCKRVVARLTEHQRREVLTSLHQDLVEWRQSVPFPLPNLHRLVPQGCMSWYDLNFCTHLTALYRPSPLFPTLDVARVAILAETSAMAVRHASSMYMQKRLSFNWLTMLTLYNSVIALVYSVTVQPQSIATTIERSSAIEDLELATDIFKALGQKFPAARTLDMLVAQIIERYKSVSSVSLH